MREALEQARDALVLMLEQFTKTPSSLKDSEARGTAYAAIAAAEAALAPPAPKVAVFRGVEYIEVPETTVCAGCAFDYTPCDPALDFMEHAFGGHCGDRHVIYIRKEQS